MSRKIEHCSNVFVVYIPNLEKAVAGISQMSNWRLMILTRTLQCTSHLGLRRVTSLQSQLTHSLLSRRVLIHWMQLVLSNLANVNRLLASCNQEGATTTLSITLLLLLLRLERSTRLVMGSKSLVGILVSHSTVISSHVIIIHYCAHLTTRALNDLSKNNIILLL